MLGVYASAAAILLASVVLGSALLGVLGRTAFTWLSGAIGFAALVVVSPLLIRLPGRGTTLAVVLAIAFLAGVVYMWRGEPVPGAGRLIRRRRGGLGGHRASPAIDSGEEAPRHQFRAAAVVVVIVLAAASLPFAFNGRNGALGEGIYTNDQAAQLYWTDWLQHGLGPEPNAVRFGYPTGPQAVAAAAAEVTGTSLLSAFNGLLLAIPVLTALAALASLGRLPAGRRVATASLTGLPYLAASFLAQSAFKETAMALLVLAFAVGLGELRRAKPSDRQRHPERAMIVGLLLLVAASVFVYSLPGLTWFAIGLPIWVALEFAAGGLRLDLGAVRDAARRHRWAIAAVAIVVVAVGVFSAAQLSGFVGKVGQVQASQGRLSSPVFPGEALGIWPKGDFRVVRGDVSGAYVALALGLAAAAFGALGAVRRRDWGLVAMGASAVIAYVGARAFASIYVEAKALAILAPLVVLASLYALFSPNGRASGLGEGEEPTGGGPSGSEPAALTRMSDAKRLTFRGGRRADPDGPGHGVRFAFGIVVAIALAGSSFLALRAAPVGFDQRADELQGLAGLVQGRSVAFLGVDRFAGYWLRGTLMRSPGGYVPSDIQARPSKVWQQGLAMDFDTLAAGRLDKFRYAITTRAGYQSTPPPNFKPVVRTASFVLWKRQGPTPDLGIIDVDGSPGAPLDCATPEGRKILSRAKTATVIADPVVNGIHAWSRRSPFEAPATVAQTLELRPGRWALSLQYHSQVPLSVSAAGGHVELPPSLDGMYLTHQAQGAFWPAGTIRVRVAGPVTVRVRAANPTRLQRLVGVGRQVWLGP
ncbi:MAG: hypothetical protein ACRDK1_11365, partial [Solirubrobacterales bacterium]